MSNEFEKLLPFKWRDMHLPITRITVSLAHDLVEHKYWGVNGARVEATGVAPIRISAVIPIANTITPGKKELWVAGGLYPDGLRSFIIRFGKRETGYVQHPEFGEIACKPEKMEFELAGERQDCTEIHASWVETLDDKIISNIVGPSSVQDIDQAVADLKASGAALKALAPNLPEFVTDLEGLGRKLTSVVDTVTALQYRTAGIVNRIIYQAHRLEVAIQRAAVDPTTRFTQLRPFGIGAPARHTVVGTGQDPQRPQRGQKSHSVTWAAVQSLEQIIASAFAIRNRLIATSGGIGLYTVPEDTTLAGLMTSLPKRTSITNVIQFNPGLMRSPIVPKGAVVRYPLPA